MTVPPWGSGEIAARQTHRPRVMIPLAGNILRFSDPYGPLEYRTEILQYQSRDGAKIEATMLRPVTRKPQAALVFVHMWARDRHTFWGLPEFLATYGYPSIYMDLRGHGNSKFPNSDYKFTIEDKRKSYKDLYLDILPAIDLLNKQPEVLTNRLILIGASLGCPLGVNAVAQRKEYFIGMIHLSPSIIYFDANCRKALHEVSHLPNFVIAETTDASYTNAIRFFDISDHYKLFYRLNHTGHGTNILFHDLGFPTIILSWIREIDQLHQTLRRIENSPMLVPVSR